MKMRFVCAVVILSAVLFALAMADGSPWGP